jgi:ABC-type amino acid transport substrate-binding protein
VIGVPSTFGLVDRTRAYYRSTYVFVSRADRRLRLQSFDDPRLRRWLVGVQITGEDYENPPPAQALAMRHLAENVRGFTVYGDYSRPDPQRAIIDAVADGRLDTAAVWGPLAGYFGPRSSVALDITPVSPPVDRSSVPFTFDISMGVRHGADALRDELDRIIERCRPEIRVILQRYGVPVVAAATARHGRRAASSSTS